MRDMLDFSLVTSSLGKDEAKLRGFDLKKPSVLKKGVLTHSFFSPDV